MSVCSALALVLSEWLKDSSIVKKKAGVSLEDSVDLPRNKQFDCPVCSETVQIAQTYAIHSVHRFCVECWKNWCSAEFDKGPACIATNCMQHKCSIKIPYTKMYEYLDNELKQDKFEKYLLDEYVSALPSLHYCPHPGCGLAAEQLHIDNAPRTVECECGNYWCWNCGREDHRPASCEDAGKWMAKNSSDAENVQYIMAHTKVSKIMLLHYCNDQHEHNNALCCL